MDQLILSEFARIVPIIVEKEKLPTQKYQSVPQPQPLDSDLILRLFMDGII